LVTPRFGVQALTSSQTIGEFLCIHKMKPIDNVDVISSQDFDIRQDAALRAFSKFQTQGMAIISDEHFIEVLNDNEPVAKASLRYARLDALRAKNGSASWRNDANAALARNVSNTTSLDHVSPSEDSDGEDLVTSLIDPDWEVAFEAIESDWNAEMREVFKSAEPIQREAIKFMAYLLDQKSQGFAIDSNSTRSKLKRLRKASGFALNARLL